VLALTARTDEETIYVTYPPATATPPATSAVPTGTLSPTVTAEPAGSSLGPVVDLPVAEASAQGRRKPEPTEELRIRGNDDR